MPILESLADRIGGTRLDAGGATVAALQQALAAGSLTSAALTAFYLERISRLNPELRAVIAVSGEARDQAAAADQAITAGQATGPLAGIPVLIKDNVAVSGLPGTAGSPALAAAESGDAHLVGRLRAAGAVIIGKANLSEWANFRSSRSSSGWSTLGGQAVNPHGAGRNPSGSSSGSGVAVAAALTPLAIGTETDGSIVSPSSACGVVGIKPTLGLVSRGGIVPISAAQDTAGPMARCVADAAALLGVIAGTDPADPATADADAHLADYTGSLDPAALAGARLGVWRESSEAATPATAAVLDAAIETLRRCGAEVVDPVELPGAGQIHEPEFTALRYEFKHDLGAYLAGLPGEHPADLAALIAYNTAHADRVLAHFGQELFEQAQATAGLTDPAYAEARDAARRLASGALDSALTSHRLDAVISLTTGPAWLTDHVLGDRHDFGTSSPAAVSGYPAVCVPAGEVRGLPVGISFAGPAWSEPRLVALAYAFEQARSAGSGRAQR
ncbi:MAG TPA: amidase [Streptosporangiaceae bacterium]